MSMKEEAASLNEKMAALSEEAKNAINEEFKKVFEKHPELTVIVWTQYTPYFNDGDECTFRVNEFTLSNAPDTENVSSYEYEGDAEDVFVIDGFYGAEAKKYADIAAIYDFSQTSLGEDVFKTTFGNHVRVRVTRDGIETEEYDHE